MPPLSAPAFATVLFPSLTPGIRDNPGNRAGPSSREAPIDTLAQAESAIGDAVTAGCAQHLHQLGKTIDALAVAAGQKQQLKQRLEACRKDFEALQDLARDIVQLEHRATMPWQCGAQAQERHIAVLMARNLKLATQCQALMQKLQSLQDEIAPHVQKRSVGKAIALAVGALLGIAGAVTLAVILWPVALTGAALGGSFLLTAACAAGTGASAAVGVIATIFGAGEAFAKPEAYRHFPDRQPQLALVVRELGTRMSRWLEANADFTQPLEWDVLKELCGGDIGAVHFCTEVQDSMLCDAAKRLVDHSSERAPAQNGLARTVSSRLIFPDQGAADSPGDVAGSHDSGWDEALDSGQMIELLWRGLGFERKNPSAAAEPAADAAAVEEGGDTASDGTLSRSVSNSSIGSYNSVDMGEGPDGLGDASAYGLGSHDSASPTVPVPDDAPAAATSAMQPVLAPPNGVQLQWEASLAWAQSRIRTAARYVQHLSTALAQPYPQRIEEAEHKKAVMVESLCAFLLLEKARSEMLVLDEMGSLHAGRFATIEAMSQLAVTMYMERGWFLGNNVTGLRVLFDDHNSIGFDRLPDASERAEAAHAWNAATAEAAALVGQLDHLCASLFQRTFRGLMVERAIRFFAQPIAARMTMMERELRQDPPKAP